MIAAEVAAGCTATTSWRAETTSTSSTTCSPTSCGRSRRATAGVHRDRAWVEKNAGNRKPPDSQFVRKPSGGDVVNSCELAPASSAGGGPTVPGGQARRPRGRLRVSVTPRRDRRRPYRFRTRGRLVRPAGVTAAAGCRGTVTVQVKAGRRTISARRARLRRSCRFSSRVTFRRAARLGRGRLKFIVRFAGNRVIAPGSARTVRVRAAVRRRPARG